jgi:hypothetical protein
MARKQEDRTDVYLWTTDDEPVSSMRARLEAVLPRTWCS